VRKFWIFIAVVLVCGAIPALYPQLWLDKDTWSLASDKLYEKNLHTLQTRLGHAAQPQLIEQFARCITQKTVEWLDQSDCPYFADSLEDKADCIEEAGLSEASRNIQLDCARKHSPAQWQAYKPLFLSDALRVLETTDIPPTKRASLAECVAGRLVASMDAGNCKPLALFEGNTGCFNAQRRARELTTAIKSCAQ
jgi:hypothetical protein